MRITKDPEVRRQEIILTAKELFEAQGINKTSMNDIAQKIGIAKGLVYYYFSSKEQLVEAVVELFIEGVEVELIKIVEDEGLDFYSKLSSILYLYFNSIQSHPAISSYSPGNPGVFGLIRDRLSETALLHAKNLFLQGLDLGLIHIEYPEYMLKILIRGLGDLYIEGVTDPQIHIRLIEQILGLEKGKLSLETIIIDTKKDASH